MRTGSPNPCQVRPVAVSVEANAESSDTVEQRAVVAPCDEMRGDDKSLSLSGPHRDVHQSLGVLVRERAEDRSVYHTEDGRIRADAERQGQDRNDGEARVLRQHPNSVPYVLEKCRHSMIPSLGL